MSKKYFLLFASLLLLTGLACNALVPADDVQDSSTNVNEVVDRAVATIEARSAVSGSQTTGSDTSNEIPSSLPLSSDLEAALIRIYERANPAVVYIITEHRSTALGSGSGFVYDAQGHIVTNNHVVAEGDRFEVEFPDGVLKEAVLVAMDVDSDLAVLKVDELPAGVTPLELADFNTVRVGQFVAALGNPFENQGSLSFGIVSGLGRSIASQRLADNGGSYSLPEVIQTDAPINPGNSGGPLLNMEGQVIGVNSAIRSTTGFNSGVGFAIPVAAVHQIVPSLIENGGYTYPYIGIGASNLPLSLDLQEQLELPQREGIYVTSVTSGSPAEAAGVVPAPSAITPGGDFIVAIDDRDVREFADLNSYLVFQTEVGQTIELTVIRDGETVVIPVTLGERP
ncbi:MAG TPA: trypsin-like peptidase domain-containing protein [Candidatus Sulfomarinibacteraceae bacterium]|nr:trypsin-like peptidase domain-containing protein [Candidatus Sulfomarinibacteraceae bacterium]